MVIDTEITEPASPKETVDISSDVVIDTEITEPASTKDTVPGGAYFIFSIEN